MTAVEPFQYRLLRAGPETKLQQAVEGRLSSLFPQDDELLWTAGSVPLGAGRPDIVLTWCKPQVVALAEVDITSRAMLAYLRAVGRARSDTISSRLGRNLRAVERSLDALVEAKIVVAEGSSFSLSADWRAVLPDVVTIEVKVANWRKAIVQAARNRIFAHRSFVALPERVVHRVKGEASFKDLGIGLLLVADSGDVRVVRRARRGMPRVWAYYYALAFLAEESLSGERRGVHRPYRNRTSTFS